MNNSSEIFGIIRLPTVGEPRHNGQSSYSVSVFFLKIKNVTVFHAWHPYFSVAIRTRDGREVDG